MGRTWKLKSTVSNESAAGASCTKNASARKLMLRGNLLTGAVAGTSPYFTLRRAIDNGIVISRDNTTSLRGRPRPGHQSRELAAGRVCLLHYSPTIGLILLEFSVGNFLANPGTASLPSPDTELLRLSK